jgi:hypothetical protein
LYNIDIDTGGTMTDGLVSGEGQVISLKVETTPHDVTIAFVDILEAARSALGLADLRTLLAQVEVIRWSSTITSNVLAQRVGPQLGLLVTAGQESSLYDPAAAATVVGSLVSAEDITGIAPDADEATVRQAIKALLDKGIRRINVSLAGAFPDGSQELRIVEMIGSDYPDHFLGSIPALAGSEVVLRPDDSTRTIASLINAYVHPALATTLYRAEEICREQHGWQGNVLIGHINGGVARIGKTKAFDTIESGPLFGTHACAAAAAEAGDAKVIAIDVGGTTAKVSAVQDGKVVLKSSGELFDIPVQLDMPLLRSIALGGGSVARVADGDRDARAGQHGRRARPRVLRPRRAQRHDHRRLRGGRFRVTHRLPGRQADAGRGARPRGAGQARRRAARDRCRRRRPRRRGGGLGHGGAAGSRRRRRRPGGTRPTARSTPTAATARCSSPPSRSASGRGRPVLPLRQRLLRVRLRDLRRGARLRVRARRGRRCRADRRPAQQRGTS